MLGVLVRILGLLESILVLTNSLLNEFLRPLAVDIINGGFSAIHGIWAGVIDLCMSLNLAVREVWLHSTTYNIARLILIGMFLIRLPSTAAAFQTVYKVLEKRFLTWTATWSDPAPDRPVQQGGGT